MMATAERESQRPLKGMPQLNDNNPGGESRSPRGRVCLNKVNSVAYVTAKVAGNPMRVILSPITSLTTTNINFGGGRYRALG